MSRRSLADLGRSLAFSLRNGLRFSLPVFEIGSATRRPADVLASLSRALPSGAEARLSELQRRYELERMAHAYTQRELQEGLYVLDLYDCFLRPLGVQGPGLDVGAKNGAHLPALATAVPGRWDGIELDARRRYATGTTREGYARHLLRSFPECTFRAGSVLELAKPYGVISWVLPFVRSGALEQWGLPLRFFEPERLLHHIWNLLAPGGVLFVVNQGEAEAEAQQSLFSTLSIPGHALGRLESVFSPFRQPRFGWVARRG